jgi:hypothetical protein
MGTLRDMWPWEQVSKNPVRVGDDFEWDALPEVVDRSQGILSANNYFESKVNRIIKVEPSIAIPVILLAATVVALGLAGLALGR